MKAHPSALEGKRPCRESLASLDRAFALDVWTPTCPFFPNTTAYQVLFPPQSSDSESLEESEEELEDSSSEEENASLVRLFSGLRREDFRPDFRLEGFFLLPFLGSFFFWRLFGLVDAEESLSYSLESDTTCLEAFLVRVGF